MGLWNRITGAASREQFVSDATERFRAIVGDVQYDEPTFTLRGGGHTLFLNNFWSQYQDAKARDRDAVIDRMLASTRELEMPVPDTFEAVRAQLRPMVHDQIYWSASRIKLRQLGLPESALPMTRPFGAHLTISVVVDLPTSMRSITDSDREDWGQDFDALLAAATQNLARTSAAKWPQERKGVWRAPYDDGYAVARLVMPSLFRDLGTRGKPVVLALGAGVVFVAGADDTAGMVALAELGEQGFKLPKPMSPVPLTLDGDRWVEYVVPADHPAKRAFDLLRYQSLAGNYDDQQAQLKALPGADEGAFIATYRAMRGKDGSLRSIATQTETVPSSLPKADYVLVMIPDDGNYKALVDVPWDVFANIVPLELEPDLAPPRYFCDGELSVVQRDALLAAARP